MHRLISLWVGISFFGSHLLASEGIIEKQLQEIGGIKNEEIVVVQREYTSKKMRHELTPITLGGIPFGTVRRTLFAGASYSLHLNDWLAWEAVNFAYAKNFFSSFTTDINSNKDAARTANQPDIKPDIQKLLYFGTTGIQVTPLNGKLSTFSQWIAYVEPFFSLGVGFAKTETESYITYFPGIGLRAFFREWFSLKLEFRDYLYTEKFTNRSTGLSDSALRNNYSVTLALSFWLPKMPN